MCDPLQQTDNEHSKIEQLDVSVRKTLTFFLLPCVVRPVADPGTRTRGGGLHDVAGAFVPAQRNAVAGTSVVGRHNSVAAKTCSFFFFVLSFVFDVL